MEIDSHRKLMSPEIVAFRFVEISPSTITINEDGMSNTVSIDGVTLRLTLIAVQDVLDDASNRNEDGLTRKALQQNVIYEQIGTRPNATERKIKECTATERNIRPWR